jgi:hypothetical protein
LPVLPQQGLKRADVEITLIDHYKDLIEDASKCNIDALQDKPTIPTQPWARAPGGSSTAM